MKKYQVAEVIPGLGELYYAIDFFTVIMDAEYTFIVYLN